MNASALALFDIWKKRIVAFPANSARPGGISNRSSMMGTKEMVLQTPAPPEQVGWSTDTGVTTMNSMKPLALATVTILSLGAGAAMAQEGGSGLSVSGGFNHASRALTIPTPNMVQSGSSDVDTVSPYNVTTHPQFDFSGAGGAA
jgi:hypothetical protein